MWVIGLVSTAWMIAIALSFVFQCFPVSKAWDFRLDGQCIDVAKLILGNAIPDIVTDLAIVIAPLPLISKLKITLSQKLAVGGVFLMGGL